MDLDIAQFTNRTAGIEAFRQKLEDLEDTLTWFNHKKSSGKWKTTYAGYLDLPGGDLLSKHNMQWRYRRDLSGSKVNKTDFVIKYKEGAPFFPDLKPMGSAPEWESAWSCKVEDNLKYVVCPSASCFPIGHCYDPCGIDGGIALEAQEQAPKIKADPGEPFALQYTSVDMFKTLADVSALFPDVVGFFNIGAASTELTISKHQYRWIEYKVNLEIDGVDVESGFVLWYPSEADMTAGTGIQKGEWSFAIEQGDPAWDLQEKALLLLTAVAEATKS